MKNLALDIEQFLMKELSQLLPQHKVAEIYHYALFPTGKLIRSQFLFTLAQDLKSSIVPDHFLAASFLEFHHAYSLIHDDLPCMDDDSERRGKPSTHIAFGEWQALLAGDGLLSLSYGALAQLKTPHLRSLMRFCTWATGPKGLIHGQVMDLSLEMNQNLKSLMKTHELKTARLFQISALMAYYLSLNKEEVPEIKEIWRFLYLGKNLGIYFQLVDDLTELLSELSTHEKAVNPFLKQKEEAILALQNLDQKLKVQLKELPHTNLLLTKILRQPAMAKLREGKKSMEQYGIDLDLVFFS
ncbi:MAG: polyprenyl synthetase family protein [Bacteriovoracaceae bacterium]